MKLNKKKIILIGQNCWFVDSFLFFKECGYEIIMIKTLNHVDWFKSNYDIIESIGGQIVYYESNYSFLDGLGLNNKTIVIGGGYFSGGINSLECLEKCSLEELEILYQISKFNYQYHRNAFIVRYFNGDSGFSSSYIADFFGKKIKYVDLLVFDNVNLQEFVTNNVEVAKNKKFIIGWIETPLRRFVSVGCSKCNRNFISIGRTLNSTKFDKINSKILYLSNRNNVIYKQYPNLIPDRNFYGLAGGKKLQFVIKDRVDFYNKYSEICFGLSHFYDAFENGNDEFYKNKYFYFSHEGQNIKFKRYSPKEMYYAFVNNPSKDIVYLMNGIIPIVSRKDGHYKELIEKKMAIFIDNIQDFEKILNMPVSKIYEYRENIYNNLDLFTFENVASKIIDEFNTRDININENMWYPIPTFDGFKNCICFIIDESYISYLSVCIQSLLDNASEHNLYDIYILYSGYLDQFIINKITSNNAKKNISIKFLKIDNFIKIIPDKIYKLFLNNIHKHISIATYYRFFIPSLFVNFEKVIYLDSDMLINSDISKLYDIDMNDFKLLAVKDIIVNLAHAKHKEIWEKKIVDSCKKCGIKDCSKYFNAGVLVFNMNKISFKDTIACFKMLKKIKDPYLIDQDILNAVFQNDVKVLDDTSWNYQNTLSFIDQDYKFYMFMDDCKNINIYHFISQYKPWLYPYIPNADIWWKYAKKTPFYEEILFNNISSKMSSNETYGAVEKVKAHLSYKLGKELLSIKENKLKVLILPFALIFIYIKHKISNLIFKLILISNPNLKSLPLNHYSDYQEALKIQNYLSYKLGNLLIKHPLTFVFRVAGLYKEWKRGR